MAIQLVFWMIIVFVIIQDASAQESSLAKPGCPPKCGNISIPYPFGIGADCSGHYNFSITCDSSSTPPRPFLVKYEVEVLEISIHEGTLSYRDQYSCTKNYDNFTDMEWSTDWKWSKYWECDDRLLPKTNNRSFSLCGENTQCSREGLCYCKYGYDGNPYMRNGCQDIDECSLQNSVYNYNWDRSVYNRCSQGCINEPVGNYTCYCYSGYKLAGDGRSCYPDHKTRTAIIGTCSGIGGLILLGITWWLYKLLQRRKEKKLKEKFFKKNGGLLLQQQISSSHEGNVEKSKIFTSKELEKATDNYNKDRILGQGGQGTVYKGMLTDGRIVAVKKSKIKNESELEPFINEVVILSKIDQRNIVKLHGSCLETEVPLLVYEFIPNGTLFQYIHEQNEDFPLSWDVRIRIAKEVAGALFYLHSSASIPIYHRDIKSTNILLDEKYRAKVADFGTSRSTTIDQTHLTTPAIQGTFGYLDPEYFQSSHFTDKSDVYSFGVVLVELLTGQKPILSDRSEAEGRSLATFFKLAMEQDRLFDILDPRVMKDDRKEEILGLANLAHRCLHLNGRKRPTMRQVVVEFEGISLPIGTASPHQHYDEVQYAATELMGPWETTSTSMESSTIYSTSIDVEPLLHAPS